VIILSRVFPLIILLKHPEEVRKFVYTTNATQSINSGLDYIRRELGWRLLPFKAIT
jgi:transposase-like protein